MGGNSFCFKVCDPADSNAANYCQHIYDRIGCAYNAPNRAQDGVFEVCEGENQDFPGVYTSGGQTLTYTQPPESLGPITSIPFTARIPASSNCVTYQSSALYTALPTLAAVSGSASASGSGAAATSGISRSVSGSASRSAGTTSPTNSASSAAAVIRRGGVESGTVLGFVAGTFGVAFAMLFLA